MQVTERPEFSAETALEFAREYFDPDSELLSELPSERDQNFLVQNRSGETAVLKISNPGEDPQVLDFQHRVLERLGSSPVGELIPHLIRTGSGEEIVGISEAGRKHFLRMMSFLPGVPLGSARGIAAPLPGEIGRILGEMDRSLEDFSHPAMHRELYWDARHALRTVEANLDFMQDGPGRARVGACLRRFEADAARLSALRNSVIHNDANDYNLLVDSEESPRRLTGIIDFGDLVATYTVCEIAIASAYLMMGKEDPLAVSSEAVRGYHQAYPLEEVEVEVFFDLVMMRICLTVSNAARQRHQAPDNEYLSISERPARALLEELTRRDREEMTQILFEVLEDETAAG